MKIRTIWRHMQAHPRTTWVAVLCLVFFAGLILPRIYDMKLRFPGQSEIHITEGLATFKSVGKSRAALLVVDGQEYVCAGPAYASPNCFVGKVAQVREAMEGEKLKIVWFKQSVYPFFSNRRVLLMEHDGRLLVSPDKVVADIRQGREAAPAAMVWIGFGLLLACMFMVWVIDKDEANERAYRQQADS
jgi:hypothetical protein